MLQLTTSYKKGIIKLATLIGLLCFFITVLKKYPKHKPQFIVNEELQCKIDNQALILAEAKQKKTYKYNVNTLTDFQGYQLGLSVGVIDSLIAFRKKGGLFFGIKQFKEVTGLSKSTSDSLLPYLFFPKKRNKWVKLNKKKQPLSTSNINKVSAEQLKKLGIPHKLAYRVINYRNSINGYKSMDDLKKVWYIEEDHLRILNKNFLVQD